MSIEVRPAPTSGPSGEVVGRVLLLPGARYSARHPLLSGATLALERLGWHVTAASWNVDGLDGADHSLSLHLEEGARPGDAARRGVRGAIVTDALLVRPVLHRPCCGRVIHS
ncbi:hypothetical protein [Marisediminicola senii]|uniref:hypothetical protein n=1 Tax=Marisediminicola senii TaxID=2711233 RepID=UPI0013EDFDE0|nr:hypothetical protein [Marisediminicola senii]